MTLSTLVNYLCLYFTTYEINIKIIGMKLVITMKTPNPETL